MAKYKPQHSRLLFIDRKIREQRYPNCASLARDWEVSVRTVQRDLDYLRDELDAPLAYSAKERGYYYTEPQYRMPAIDLRERDLFAIYLAERLLSQYQGTPVYDSLRTVFAKIEDSLPDRVTTKPGSDQELFTVLPPSATSVDPQVFTTVLDGLRHQTRLHLVYRHPQGAASERQVDPYHGVRYEGDWYIIGHCHLRGALRTFSLARILSVRKGVERFIVPPDFDVHALFGSHFGIHWGQDAVQVRIHFLPQAAVYVRERQWHPSQHIEELADGALILNLTISHLLEVQRWILSWGEAAKVLCPRHLAESIQATAQRLVQRYDQSSPQPGM